MSSFYEGVRWPAFVRVCHWSVTPHEIAATHGCPSHRCSPWGARAAQPQSMPRATFPQGALPHATKFHSLGALSAGAPASGSAGAVELLRVDEMPAMLAQIPSPTRAHPMLGPDVGSGRWMSPEALASELASVGKLDAAQMPPGRRSSHRCHTARAPRLRNSGAAQAPFVSSPGAARAPLGRCGRCSDAVRVPLGSSSGAALALLRRPSDAVRPACAPLVRSSGAVASRPCAACAQLGRS